MASHPSYIKKQLAIDNVSWTAVKAPVDCMGVSIKNSVMVAMLIRTDATDATTQDTIAAGAMENIAPPRSSVASPQNSGSRFDAGDTICYLQAASGTGPALITYAR